MEKKELSKGSTLAIGIDLGTTNSCVAVWERDHVEIIVSDEGLRTTPSYVSFTDEEKLVGNVAQENAAIDPINTICVVKRFIGCRSSDPCVKKDMKLLPVAVDSSKEDKLKFIVQFKGEKKQFSAEEISSMILTKMKQIAEKYHGCTVKDAVITVPANFSDSQRRATKEAGILAGLNVMRLMDEPSAAALAYCFNKIPEYTRPQNVFVFDLGGGTFDASLVNICGGHFQIKATAGDTHLGGEDFVNRILMKMVEELKRKHTRDILNNPEVLRRLKTACESTKKSLSAASMSIIHVPNLYPNLHFSYKLSRNEFEQLNKDLFEKCIELTKQCLEDAKVDKSDVDIVVLAGGSSRIPKVQELLEEYFGGQKLHRNINPDEAVAYGAAVMAAKLSGVQGSDMINNIVLTDVTPLSLGVDVVGDVMSIVIPRNTPIPTKKVVRGFGKLRDNQKSMPFSIYEGERIKASSNNLLGKLRVSDISSSLVDVCFEIDADGILNASATVQSTGEMSMLQITNEEIWLKKETIDKMMNEAEKSKTEDEELKRKYGAWIKLNTYTKNAIRTMRKQELVSLISECERKKIEEQICAAFNWLELNYKPFASVEASESKLLELKKICEPIIALF